MIRLWGTPAAVGLAIALGLLSVPAAAQINFYEKYVIRLSQGDLDSMNTAAAALYAGPVAQIDAISTWKNPKSGNSGVVKLIGIYRYKGMPCRRLAYAVRLKGEADPKRFRMDRCRVENGDWKIRF